MRLPLLAQLDMPQRMCPYIKEHSLGLPCRLGRLSGGPPLRLRHPGDTLNLRLLSSFLSFEAFYAPEEVGRSPEGVFGGRSLSPIYGPVGFRGVAPHHRPRAGYCPSSLYTADGSNIRHSPSLRYQDAQISRRLVDSSRIQDHLSPGQGQAFSSVQGAATTSQFQEIVLDPISGPDLSRHADPVSSVHCKTDRDEGRNSPQDHRGVSFIPGPPSSSLVSSSGPPFVPSSSGKGWDVKDAVSPDSPQVQVGLPRRFASHPLGSCVSGGSFMVVLGDSKREGLDFSLPVPDLNFYSDASDVSWGAIVGEHQVSGVWTPSQRELSINLREMMAVQKGLLEFSSLLRGKTIALFCVIDLFATSLTARLPVFFAPAWEPKAVRVDAFLQPWDNLQAYALPLIAIIKRVLLKLRASHNCDLTLLAPLLASKGMVSRSAGTSIRHSNRTTQTSRSAATTAFPSVSRKSPYASSDCVATLGRFASQAGFFATVAGQLALCRRKFTRLN